MNDEEIERRYTYHAPDSATRELHDNFRTHERWYAKAINDIPGGDTREKSLAFTALEEMSFGLMPTSHAIYIQRRTQYE